MTCHRKLKRQRVRLFQEQEGLCYWCDEPMVMPERYASGPQPDNYCTVDHLRHRSNPGRREPNRRGEQRRVAACALCNRTRGDVVNRALHPPKSALPGKSDEVAA